MKPNILFLVQTPPPIHGASLRNQSLIDSELLNEKFNLIVFPLNFAKDVLDIGAISLRKILKSIFYFFKLFYCILVYNIDLVYFTISPVGGAFYRDILFVFLLKIFRKKILYHLRGKGIKKEANSSKMKRILYKYVFRNTKVICLSKIPTADIETVYKNKPFIVNNGIKIEVDEDDIVEKYNKPIKLLYLSNLASDKGIYDFLEAIKLINEKQIDFQADIIGKEYDVTFKDINKFLTENLLDKKVNVLGSKYGKEKFEYLLNSDIFIFPTYYKNEVFPGVILEAMQCAKSIITTFEASIPDILDQDINGILVEQRNIEKIAEKIELLIENKELRIKLGKNAREKFLKKYTLNHFENKMYDIFKELV
mgnify:CR=1 FL=1